MSDLSELPPLSGLRAFEVAGRHLNFRAAADELGVTQGAVAQQVRSLEAALGVRLFDRQARGVAFTSPGRHFHADVADAFNRLREATASLKPAMSRVTVSVTPTFASRWLIPHLADFTSRHPDIDLRILATERVLSFASDGIDLAVRQGRPPFRAHLDSQLLFHQSIVAVAAPALVAGLSIPLDARTLQTLPLLHDTHNLWPEFLHFMGIRGTGQRERQLQFNQTALSVEAALAGHGVALASLFLVQRELAAGHLVRVMDGVFSAGAHFYLLAPPAIRRHAAVDIVAGWLEQQHDGNP